MLARPLGKSLGSRSFDSSIFARFLDEADARNVDNVARTASYLELYAAARARGVELPWLLMAHLVSRHAGVLMTDVAHDEGLSVFVPEARIELFLMLERANFIIFYDAWRHVLAHLLGTTDRLAAPIPEYMRRAWRAYEAALAGRPTRALERRLVLDLVTNEQNLIGTRVLARPRFGRALAIISVFEEAGRDRPIKSPVAGASVRVGGFRHLDRRIDAGMRIFEETLEQEVDREALFAWAVAHPHVGLGEAGKTLRQTWPVEAVHAAFPAIHAPPEPDPAWP
jgi:hypothetical protein